MMAQAAVASALTVAVVTVDGPEVEENLRNGLQAPGQPSRNLRPLGAPVGLVGVVKITIASLLYLRQSNLECGTAVGAVLSSLKLGTAVGSLSLPPLLAHLPSSSPGIVAGCMQPGLVVWSESEPCAWVIGISRADGPAAAGAALGEDVPQVSGGEKIPSCFSAAKGSGFLSCDNTSHHLSHFRLLMNFEGQQALQVPPKIAGKVEVAVLVTRTGERQARSLADTQVPEGVGQ